MEHKYEIAVIGTGPAGLSAALNCYSRGKDFIIIGPKTGSFKVKSSKSVMNYLGFGAISGKELNNSFLDTIDRLGFTHIDTTVNSVYSLPDGFFIELKDGSMIESKSVVIATGVSTSRKLKGEEEFIGNGISYCATCDANLYRGKDVVVLGYNEESKEEATFLTNIVKSVTFVNLTGEEVDLGEDVVMVNDKPIEFVGDEVAEKLILENSELKADCFFIVKDSEGLSDMVPGLDLDKKHVKVDKNFATNLTGLFACGDVTGLPYQVAKAVGEGNIAGLNASKYIELLKR